MNEYNRELLFQVLNNNGIFFDDDNLELPLEVDSITFVTLVVDLENMFSISFPNEKMFYDSNISILKLEEILKSLLIK